MNDEPALFYTVQTIPRGSDAFEVVGIFSKREEAEAFALPYRESEWHHFEGSVDGPMPMSAILADLARQRLGAVAQSLEKLGVPL